MNVIDERIAQEKNEIRKTYISNPHGLTQVPKAHQRK